MSRLIPDNQKQTILIIDDEVRNLRMMVKYLKQYGYRVLVSQDGASGLARAHYAQPDLILLDVVLPDLDGYAICRQLKASNVTGDIPVIFMTILTIPEDKTKAFAAGGVDFITKPVQWEEVIARVRTHLRLQALTQELRETNQRLEQLIATYRSPEKFCPECPLGAAPYRS